MSRNKDILTRESDRAFREKYTRTAETVKELLLESNQILKTREVTSDGTQIREALYLTKEAHELIQKMMQDPIVVRSSAYEGYSVIYQRTSRQIAVLEAHLQILEFDGRRQESPV